MTALGEKQGKFWFSSGIPDEVKDSCKDIFIKYEALIPNWCNEVRVYWDAVGDESDGNLTSAYMEANYAYRFACLYICPPFLSEEPEDRELRIKHELCHIVSFPLVSYVRDVVAVVAKDETLSLLVTRETSEKIEAMTEDLTYIVTALENSFSSTKTKQK